MAQLSRLVVKNLCHSFGPAEILRDLSFTLEQGKVVAVVGPSGGGKTTLLHLCAGLLDVTEGQVNNTFSDFAFAFQDARLLPWQTSLDNIAFGLKARGVEKGTRQRKAAEIGIRLGLEKDDLQKFPKDLSGGMRQRVAFARALVVEPDLLFLDEPFSALDIGLKRELQDILVTKVKRDRLSILFITHDLMEAIRISDEVLLLDSNPSPFVERFHFTVPVEQRDDEYVYQQAARLLSNPQIIRTFELTSRELTGKSV